VKKIHQAFQELGSSNNVTYHQLRDRLKKLKVFPDGDEFWDLECFKPESLEDPTSPKLFLEKYGSDRSLEDLLKLKLDIQDEVRLNEQDKIKPLHFTQSHVGSFAESHPELEKHEVVTTVDASSAVLSSLQSKPVPLSPLAPNARSGGFADETQQVVSALANLNVASNVASTVNQAVGAINQTVSTVGTDLQTAATQTGGVLSSALHQLTATLQSVVAQLSSALSGLVDELKLVATESKAVIAKVKDALTGATVTDATAGATVLTQASRLFDKAIDQARVEMDHVNPAQDKDGSIKARLQAHLDALKQDKDKVLTYLRAKYRQILHKTQKRARRADILLLVLPSPVQRRFTKRVSWDEDSSLLSQHYESRTTTQSNLPPFLDYAYEFHEVTDQGSDELGASHAICALKEWQEYRNSDFLGRFAPGFLETSVAAVQGDDVTVEDFLAVVQQIGVVPATNYDSVARRYGQISSSDFIQLQSLAANAMIDGYLRIRDAANLRSAMWKYGPCLISLPVFNPNKIKFWDDEDAGSSIIGYQTCVIVGYNDINETARVRNSFGSGWADFGHVDIPYEDLFQRHVFVILFVDGPTQLSKEEQKWKKISYDPLSLIVVTDVETPEEALARKLARKSQKDRARCVTCSAQVGDYV
jgi:hypothetical protein